jgi:hypothetical protein
LSHRRDIYALPLPFRAIDWGYDWNPAELARRAARVEYVAYDHSTENRVAVSEFERIGFRPIGRFGSVDVLRANELP